MVTKSTVAAIVPLYNGRDHCVAALRSIFEQTRVPDEIIVIDDGSTDGSADVLRAAVAGELEPLVRAAGVVPRFLAQANAGQSSARNAAAEAASSDLLAFLDQDDRWAPRHVEVLAAPFDGRPELGWVYSDFDEIDGQGLLVTQSFMAHAGLRHPKHSLEELLAGDLMILPSASVLRAEAYRAVGGFDIRLCGYEDDDLFVRMFRAGWRADFVPEPLTLFRVHGTSATASARYLESRVRFLDNIVETVPDNHRMGRYLARDVGRRLARTTITDYRAAIRAGDEHQARLVATTMAEIQRRIGADSVGDRVRRAAMQRPDVLIRVRRFHRELPAPVRRLIVGAVGLAGGRDQQAR